MASLYFDPEDYLDEVSTEDLIAELNQRDDKPKPDHDPTEELETALWHAQSGRKNEALLHLERALPQFKGLLWQVTP